MQTPSHSKQNSIGKNLKPIYNGAVLSDTHSNVARSL